MLQVVDVVAAAVAVNKINVRGYYGVKTNLYRTH